MSSKASFTTTFTFPHTHVYSAVSPFFVITTIQISVITIFPLFALASPFVRRFLSTVISPLLY